MKKSATDPRPTPSVDELRLSLQQIQIQRSDASGDITPKQSPVSSTNRKKRALSPTRTKHPTKQHKPNTTALGQYMSMCMPRQRQPNAEAFYEYGNQATEQSIIKQLCELQNNETMRITAFNQTNDIITSTVIQKKDHDIYRIQGDKTLFEKCHSGYLDGNKKCAAPSTSEKKFTPVKNKPFEWQGNGEDLAHHIDKLIQQKQSLFIIKVADTHIMVTIHQAHGLLQPESPNEINELLIGAVNQSVTAYYQKQYQKNNSSQPRGLFRPIVTAETASPAKMTRLNINKINGDFRRAEQKFNVIPTNDTTIAPPTRQRLTHTETHGSPTISSDMPLTEEPLEEELDHIHTPSQNRQA